MTKNDGIKAAAREMFARYGNEAAKIARERVENLAREGAWPEHAVALQVLTEVEKLLPDSA